MNPDLISTVFDRALKHTCDKIQGQANTSVLSLLLPEDPLRQALSMVCDIAQIGHQHMIMLFEKHSCKDQEMVNELTHLRNRIEKQCKASATLFS